MSEQQPSRQELIAAYKLILRDCIDQRPSGLRQKIARVLGTHKSFISQITNPDDPTPIPARHLDTIMDMCHFSRADRSRFLEAYNTAHPQGTPLPRNPLRHYRTLHIQVPMLDDPDRQEALEIFIRDTVRRLWGLMDHKQ